MHFCVYFLFNFVYSNFNNLNGYFVYNLYLTLYIVICNNLNGFSVYFVYNLYLTLYIVICNISNIFHHHIVNACNLTCGSRDAFE